MKAVLRQAPYPSRSDLRSALEEYSTSLSLGNRSFGRFICILVFGCKHQAFGVGGSWRFIPVFCFIRGQFWAVEGEDKGAFARSFKERDLDHRDIHIRCNMIRVV